MNKYEKSQAPARINIAINANTLAKALAAGSISISEMKGLDMQAKQSLRRLCLEACL
ncbi:hypothetical protein NO559_11120 [Dasania sp. GY-MA-18]|uniref:Uncharacterized protein n=1 Tax=Dasania phycosphaerae TaxID=2950436 RepID=A0A9J6RNK1_9GAMM|nr:MULTISPECIES: hypothetical protein [Dasania]MCR8923328.1 hypothetical protein [Dasania sp. GY-MA-18]MCZ0865760.1 hypothetical protein [Dasania phycosphaerae]MCZ0869485.1 hypothetical protein [Dasania phycosphaerae]